MVVLKQLGTGPELVHCHDTLALEAVMTSAVTQVGVGGAGVVNSIPTIVNYNIIRYKMYIPLAGRETIMGALDLLI